MKAAGDETGAVPTRTLVIGGARSGKSRNAEALALRTGLEAVYVATATAWDAEMETRIARHRDERAGAGWHTVEAPLALVEVLRREAVPGRVLLVDCLTLWLSNVMLGGHDTEREASALVAALPDLAAPIFFVSNEVGWGSSSRTISSAATSGMPRGSSTRRWHGPAIGSCWSPPACPWVLKG